MEIVITVVALMFLLFVAVAYAVVRVVGAAKRSVDHTINQARRTVEDSTLRVKSYAQPGPAGEIAQLRLRLRTTMRATQDALHARMADDASLKESMELFERLSTRGHELDDELKRLESEPDRAALSTRLPELRERTQRITRAADSLRWAARDRAHRFADEDLDNLSAQIDIEADALRHWVRDQEPPQRRRHEPRSAERPGPAASAGRPAGSDRRTEAPADGWPQPAAAPGAASAEQTWHEPAAESTDDAATPRPAIGPTVARPTYPWQKKTRPENTA